MEKEKKGRQYQDTVFRMYFNDAARLKEVAGALREKIYAAEESVQIVTLEGPFLSQLKNGISFLRAGRHLFNGISFLRAGRHLFFVEHQSTANRNMPLRCWYYVCEQLRQYVPTKKLYQNKPIRLPAPEFHVFYTGSRDMPETHSMKLSDAFLKTDEDIHLELKVNFHNIAYDKTKPLLKKSRSLHDYSFFMDRIKRNMANGMKRATAIREAMRYCEEHDIMKEFLQRHEGEVVDMVNFEWNQKDFEEAVLEEGMEAGKVAVVLEMLRDRLPLETIARLSKFSLDRVKEIGKTHSLL